jgi:hypothetical protein
MSLLEELYAEYPRLRAHSFRYLSSLLGRDWRGKPYRNRKMEFYPPGEAHNPFPGYPTIEQFDPSMSKYDVLGEIFSHYVPQVDSVFAAGKQRFMDLLTPAQKRELHGDYQHQVHEGLFETRVPTFEEWLARQGGDGAFRGYVAKQLPASFYTREQLQIFQELMAYLKGGPPPAFARGTERYLWLVQQGLPPSEGGLREFQRRYLSRLGVR